MIIKVCGMRDAENIRDVVELGVDMIGMIFWKESPRYVSMVSSRAGIIPDYVESDAVATHGKVKTVGVFVDDMPQNIVTRVYNYKLDYVQLHGSESAIMIDNLRRTLSDISPKTKIIKALSIADKADIDNWKEYEGHVDMFLFDTKCKTVGGSGKQFDWSLLSAYDGDIPFILSGGIGPDDAENVKSCNHPMCVGVDLNSRFEIEPAVKDVEKIKYFVAEIRK